MKLLRINRHPSAWDLRVFATLWLIFLGGAGWLAWRQGASGLATALWVAGAGIGLTGLAWPQAVRGVYFGAVYAAFPIGFVVSHLILGGVYFLVITPVGLCARLFGYDPLERKFDRARKSYWQPRGPARPPAGYFRQH